MQLPVVIIVPVDFHDCHARWLYDLGNELSMPPKAAIVQGINQISHNCKIFTYKTSLASWVYRL
jgi:hypothetical protein